MPTSTAQSIAPASEFSMCLDRGLGAPQDPAEMLAAVPADWPAVMAMMDRYFRQVDRDALVWWLTGQRPWFQVMREAGQVTGFTHVQPRPAERTLWINLFAVAPTCLRSGHGSRMMAACERTAAEQGLDTLGLCCREDNTTGQAFFRSQGFVPQGIEPGGEPGRRFIVLSRPVAALRSPAALRSRPDDPAWLRKVLRLGCLAWLRWGRRPD